MKSATVLSLLTLFVISACGYSVDRSSSSSTSQVSYETVSSLSDLLEGLSSSQLQQIYESISSSEDLAALLSSALSSAADNTTVEVEITTDNSTVTTAEDATEDSEDSEESEEDSTTSTSSTSSSSDSTTFVQDLLTAHNVYRTLHGVANLTLNSTLNAYALEWAQYLADNTLLQHRTDPIYGENIYWSSAETTAQAAADAWYSEISDYTDYTTEPDMTSFASGHFTQMVWKNSEQLGCGSVTASSGAFFVVCNYSPPGNYIGEFVENVLEPSS